MTVLTVSAFGGFCGSAASLDNGVARSPGAWNDPDMLEVGISGTTFAEYRTRLSLWAEMAAPLMAGTDVRYRNAATISILTNRKVIDADQDRSGAQRHPVLRDGRTSVWAKRRAGSDVAVLMLNAGDTPTRASAALRALELRRARRYQVRDLWTHRDSLAGPVLTAGAATRLDVPPAPPHGAVDMTTLRGRVAR